jgi:hypothetical protein
MVSSVGVIGLGRPAPDAIGNDSYCQDIGLTTWDEDDGVEYVVWDESVGVGVCVGVEKSVEVGDW